MFRTVRLDVIAGRRLPNRGENMMDASDQLDQLSRRLSWQGTNPLDTVINGIIARLTTAGATLIASLQRAACERPLITLLLSCQLGYLTGRMGRRYARW